MLLTTIFETIKTFQIFFVFYLLVPMFFMKSSNKNIPLLDRFFFGFVSVALFQIVVVHVLVLVKLFDVISLTFLLVTLFIILVRMDKTKDMYCTKMISRIYLVFDAFDLKQTRVSFFRSVKENLGYQTKQLAASFQNLWKPPQFPLLFSGVLIFSGLIRLHHSLTHYGYYASDTYLHLVWLKAMISNELFYLDGIYPKGMHAMIAFMSKLTYFDPYWIVRYFGPFFCVLLVVSIYFLTVKITGNRYLSLLAMAIYGLTTNNAFLPSLVIRQTVSLPQEVGMLFIVLGYAFLIDYMKTKKTRYLFAFEACLFHGLICHSFSGIFLILWAAVTIMVSLISGAITLPAAFRFTGISAVVSALTFVPMVIGRLLGKQYYQASMELVTDVNTLKINDFNLWGFFSSLVFPHNLLMGILVYGGSAFIFVAIYMRMTRKKETDDKMIALLVSTGILYLMYHTRSLIDAVKLPELLDQSRMGTILSLLLPIAAASIAFYMIESFLRYAFRIPRAGYIKIKHIFGGTIVACLLLNCIISGNLTKTGYNYHAEYDEAAEAYVRIKAEFAAKPLEAGNWYIVSTFHQFAQAMGYGWFDEGYQFVFKYTKEEVMQPDFRFDYPVNNVFIFVEKTPLLYNEPITIEYGTKELEPLNEDPADQYYVNGENRAIMEGHIWMLADAYAKTHDNVSIYYEDKDFMIYRIYQEIEKN